jgi:putative hydrolase
VRLPLTVAGPYRARMSNAGMVDWDLAVSTAGRIAKPGPNVSMAEARAAVASLRSLAVEAREHVERTTGLHASVADAPIAVVDRAGWVQANAVGFQAVVDPLVMMMRARRDAAEAAKNGADVTVDPSTEATEPTDEADGFGFAKARGAVDAVGSRLTGVQVGALLGYLSSRVLGQYELFTADGAPPRLLLVAPNLVAAERAMRVDPRDFRLWVAVHEETHRVQFTANPWLGDHLRGEVRALVEATDLDPGSVAGRLKPIAEAVGSAVRGNDGPAMADAVTTPEQRVVLDRVTAVMTLLEGHADFVMDAVGADVVPSVATIRSRFEERRNASGRLESVVRRLLGIDAKLAQYRNGSAFVRSVVDEVGMDGFNRVWQSPETLPRPEEIADPSSWVRRVVAPG